MNELTAKNRVCGYTGGKPSLRDAGGEGARRARNQRAPCRFKPDSGALVVEALALPDDYFTVIVFLSRSRASWPMM